MSAATDALDELATLLDDEGLHAFGDTPTAARFATIRTELLETPTLRERLAAAEQEIERLKRKMRIHALFDRALNEISDEFDRITDARDAARTALTTARREALEEAATALGAGPLQSSARSIGTIASSGYAGGWADAVAYCRDRVLALTTSKPEVG